MATTTTTPSILTHLLTSLPCDCDWAASAAAGGGGGGLSLALVYKIVAIVSILIASAGGVSLPILCRNVPTLHPDSKLFFLVKAFAAGVILATGFVHILPDAFESLSSTCLGESGPWSKFPVPGFVAMLSAVITMIIDTVATSYFGGSNLGREKGVLPDGDLEDVAVDGGEHEGHHVQVHSHGVVQVHSHAAHGHSHGSAFASRDSAAGAELLRHRVVSQVLELGIVVHSVIIGISLGASPNTKTIKPLVAALTFHQFFEGLGLGACISQASYRFCTSATMVAFFSLTTPIGIGAGICISQIYSGSSQTTLVVGGLLNSASAGILIYMALVDLLAEDFRSPRLAGNLRLQLGGYVSLLLGMMCMSSLAGWA